MHNKTYPTLYSFEFFQSYLLPNKDLSRYCPVLVIILEYHAIGLISEQISVNMVRLQNAR